MTPDIPWPRERQKRKTDLQKLWVSNNEDEARRQLPKTQSQNCMQEWYTHSLGMEKNNPNALIFVLSRFARPRRSRQESLMQDVCTSYQPTNENQNVNNRSYIIMLDFSSQDVVRLVSDFPRWPKWVLPPSKNDFLLTSTNFKNPETCHSPFAKTVRNWICVDPP